MTRNGMIYGPARSCKVVAHRGFSAIAPENTIASIKEAIRVGADYSEFDVRSTGTGEAVLFHDEELDRTTDGTGRLADISIADLRDLDAGAWKDARYAGEKVPRLEEALWAFKNSVCTPVLEIKDGKVVESVVDMLGVAGSKCSSVVISFDPVIVKAVQEKVYGIQCGQLFDKYPRTVSSDNARIAWLAEQAVSCGADMVDVHHTMLSPRIAEGLHRVGITVWCWTVNDSGTMKDLLRIGADGIATDRPDLLMEIIRNSSR